MLRGAEYEIIEGFKISGIEIWRFRERFQNRLQFSDFSVQGKRQRLRRIFHPALKRAPLELHMAQRKNCRKRQERQQHRDYQQEQLSTQTESEPGVTGREVPKCGSDNLS